MACCLCELHEVAPVPRLKIVSSTVLMPVAYTHEFPILLAGWGVWHAVICDLKSDRSGDM
jgi:hypothetical protein